MSEQPLTPPTIPDERPQLIDSTVKTMRMRKNLEQVQSKLRPVAKQFSKAVHQPLIRLVSDAIGNTIARPTGLLGGGLVAFLGSSGYLWLAHLYDLTYNYTFFWMFFVAGFVLGLISEFLASRLRKSRR